MAAEDVILEDRLQAFGSLVGLVLALLTLFTAQRWSAVKELKTNAKRSQLLRAGGWALDSLLLLLTMLLFVSGMPLALAALSELEPLRSAGALQSAFSVIWIALLGLMAWQVALVRQSIHLAKHPPPKRP